MDEELQLVFYDHNFNLTLDQDDLNFMFVSSFIWL